MKVALISFHNAYNFGAALQAYGLQNAVEKMGIDCEYINYVNTSRREAYDMITQIRHELIKKNLVRVVKLLVGIPFMMGRKRAFNRFYAKNLRKTAQIYTTSEEAEALNGQYDKFVVGSDQVWNPENNGGDCAFLLDFVHDNSKRISYSSSFGVQEIPEALAADYAKHLSSFYRLATRESIGVEIIHQLCGRDAHLVLDPVFLPDRNVWEAMEDTAQEFKKDYVFFYTNKPTQIDDFLSTGYDMSHKEYHILSSHITPGGLLNRQKKVKFSMSPEQFLAEIKNAKLVVTASFHCLAFSIIFHKPFVAILTDDRGKDERVLNLLRICNLENRILSAGMTISHINDPIDYNAVEEKLEKYRNSSRNYLRNALLDKDDIDFSCNKIPNSAEMHNIKGVSNRCTGCTACASSCPLDAISMQPNEEGFLMPIVDEVKCTSCGICVKKCQVIEKLPKRVQNQHYYGLKNRDEIRKKSSSGGAFTFIAERVLSEDGVICAAVMDSNYKVSHQFVEQIDQLERMRGTFYVQSDLKDCFPRMKSYLSMGKKVLFVGTPCQVSGLHFYLGREYENLLLVDIVCHGVPSPMIFQAFIDEIKSKGELTQFKFRDPEHGWSGYHVSAVINGKKTTNTLYLQSFNNLFSHNLINRKSCAYCQYTNYNRQGDITIGDFWGIQKAAPDFADEYGVSLVMTNTEKGERLLADHKGISLKEFEKSETVQHSLVKSSAANAKRADAFDILNRQGYETLSKKLGENNLVGKVKDIVRKQITK